MTHPNSPMGALLRHGYTLHKDPRYRTLSAALSKTAPGLWCWMTHHSMQCATSASATGFICLSNTSPLKGGGPSLKRRRGKSMTR